MTAGMSLFGKFDSVSCTDEFYDFYDFYGFNDFNGLNDLNGLNAFPVS
ncbi:MAG: hypothetical protein P8017_09600 [Deltaproteobacteria bacterium]|jgi:hypothetical protein